MYKSPLLASTSHVALGRKTGGRRAGTPHRATASIREVARQYTVAAVETLDAIMRDPAEQAIARIRAAEILLDRGYGKPHQSADVELTTHDTGPRIINVVAFDPSSGPAAPTYRPDGLPPPDAVSK